MKAFGLAHLTPAAITDAFVEVRPFIGHCRFRDCQHDREPGCAVRDAIAQGKIDARRAQYLRRFMQQVPAN